MKIVGVVVLYNPERSVLDNIKSYSIQIDFLLVVDNSERVNKDIVRSIQDIPNIRYIWNGENKGIAYAMNQGATFASENHYDWLLTMDQDSMAAPSMISEMLSALTNEETKDNIGIIAANPYDVNAKAFLHLGEDRKTGLHKKKTVISSGNLVNMLAFEKVGFFNEKLFLYYVDDEFCLRMCRYGFAIVCCPNAVLLHSEGNKMTKRVLWKTCYYNNYSDIAVYYIARNAVYMIVHYFSDYRYVGAISRRLITDFIKICIFERRKTKKIQHMFKGIAHAIIGRYGRIDYKKTF